MIYLKPKNSFNSSWGSINQKPTASMAAPNGVVSKVKEYYCQYTNQLWKKHKTWHDGKLKYFLLNNKFQLYTVEDNVLLSSEFVTNMHQLQHILDSTGFGAEEHKIFSQYIVVIESLHCQYERDINGFIKDNKRYFISKADERSHPSTTMVPNRTITAVPPEHSLSRTRFSNSLALQFNKPFQPPRRISKSRTNSRAQQPDKLQRIPLQPEDHSVECRKMNHSRSGSKSGTIKEVLINNSDNQAKEISRGPQSLALDMRDIKTSKAREEAQRKTIAKAQSVPAVSLSSNNLYSTEFPNSLPDKVYRPHNLQCNNMNSSSETPLFDLKDHLGSGQSSQPGTEIRISRRRVTINHEPISLSRTSSNA